MDQTTIVLTSLFVCGIVAEAMTGALAAGRKNMDMVGVVFIAVATAFGGGTVRDVLLGNYPLIWVEVWQYLLLVIFCAFITVWFSPLMPKLKRLFLVLDALGLMAFTVLGIEKTLALGHNYVIAAVMGILTGVSGGIIRDVLCNRVPLVFQRELYASVSLLSAILYIALTELGLPHMPVVAVTLIFGFGLRMMAIRNDWAVPRFIYNADK